MGIIERREREKEQLRTRIVEAARDILSESGLEGLSMREIARRIEYSPATIYLYFQNKEELIRAVVVEGMRVMSQHVREEMEKLSVDATPAQQWWASGRGYVRFGLENVSYFHVIFDLPMVGSMEECTPPREGESAMDEPAFDRVVRAIEEATEQGQFKVANAQRGAVVSWGMLHGMLSLYLSGHLREVAPTREDFEALVDWAMATVGTAWQAGVRMPSVAEAGVGGEA